MNSIVTLAIKDIRLLLRDKMGLFFVIAFPVLMGVFFGLINRSFASSEDRRNMQVGVVDEDESEMSGLFLRALSETKSVEVQRTERSEAMDRVRRGQLVGFIGIPRGFGETAGIMWLEGPALELGVDPSRQAESAMLQGMIMQAMGSLIQQRFSRPGSMREQMKQAMANANQDAGLAPEAQAVLNDLFGTVDEFLASMDQYQDKLAAGGGEGPKMELARIESVDVTRAPSERERLLQRLRSPWDISFPSAIMWGIMGCVAGFAISIVKERTGGTMLRLAVAPITRTEILAGKGLACFLSAAGVIVFMMILGKFLGIQLNSLPLLIMAIVCVSSCFVGLMMLMSVIGKTEQAVGGAGWAIITVLCMFGGGMIPLAFMPGWMQSLSNFSPVKWGILALEGAIWRGFTLSEMLVPCGILLGIGAVAFAAGATILSRERV
jgi:ABC-2 type transport system permease protein